MSTKSVKRRVALLEHGVHPEGHIALEKQNEASGTLGARSASLRVRRARETK
jgi:hypothetical protein